VSLSPRARVAWPFIAVVFAAALAGATIDPGALLFSGNEKISAVFLLDGQAYFGHIEDVPWSNSVTLRDVYYFADARNVTTDLSVALVKRGSELHQPADGMSIRRDKILAIERLSIDSAVAKAIAAQRALERLAAAK
jgi:hypothetical protein